MFIQLLFVLFVKIVLGDSALRINNVNEFMDFSKNVNIGNNYSGTTVYLDSDLSFSGKTLEPIGNDTRNYFLGVFDGQGHTISDLKMNFPSQYTGLFGFSNWLTIKNVVLDSSCSITCNFTGNINSVRVGGLVGWCHAKSGQCNIENSVNMAGVTFSGDVTGDSGSLYLGGIAGYLCSLKYPVYVKNCVNYGSVTHSGKVSKKSNIGGIAGHIEGSSQSYTYVYNCLNYGTITHSGTTTNSLRIGGISGYSQFTYIENCVSAGRIPTQNALPTSSIGSIVGYVYSGTNITHCYYTSGVRIGKVYEGTKSTLTITETPDFPSIVNSALITDLNNYATKKGWSKWLLNVNNASVSFIINYGRGFTVNSQVILLPDLANSSERNFSGWYADTNLNTLFNLSQVESDITLYGMFCGSSKYTVTLDVNGGNELGENETTVGCMSYYGPFPENVTRAGHTLIGWFTEREGGGYKVESGDKIKTLSNYTLYAQWVINNYAVTFDFYNGTVVNKTFIYNTSIEYPKNEDMKREGYTFNGWNGTAINMPAQNITITAQWSANNYTVAFDFDNGTTVIDTFVYNTFIEYPKNENIKREGYTFNGWDETVINMPAQNITTTAQWTPNNYTVTFDVNGGNDLSETSMAVTFNSPYESLPTSSKEGYMFVGWFTDKNASVTNESIVSIADNHTLHAHWEKATNQVEIVFNTKDLSREDIEEIVRRYTDAEFKITEFEEESGEVRVIIKFVDVEEAENFVENIRESSEMGNIKKISFVLGDASSISTMLCPIMLFNVIFFI